MARLVSSGSYEIWSGNTPDRQILYLRPERDGVAPYYYLELPSTGLKCGLDGSSKEDILAEIEEFKRAVAKNNALLHSTRQSSAGQPEGGDTTSDRTIVSDMG